MFPIIKKLFSKLTHTGPSKMVNVGNKSDTFRYARASCKVKVNSEVLKLIKENQNTKGDVLRTAEIAGIMGGKKTSSLVWINCKLDSIMSSTKFKHH